MNKLYIFTRFTIRICFFRGGSGITKVTWTAHRYLFLMSNVIIIVDSYWYRSVCLNLCNWFSNCKQNRFSFHFNPFAWIVLAFTCWTVGCWCHVDELPNNIASTDRFTIDNFGQVSNIFESVTVTDSHQTHHTNITNFGNKNVFFRLSIPTEFLLRRCQSKCVCCLFILVFCMFVNNNNNNNKAKKKWKEMEKKKSITSGEERI